MPLIIDHLQSEGRLQGSGLILDLTSQATAAGTLSLAVTSNTNQFFTGTTAGQLINLPNATTLRQGRYFHIWNNSTQDIAVRDNGGNLLRTVRPDTVAVFIVTDIGTANGTWVHRRQILTDHVSEAVATAPTQTTSATDEALADMSVTPPRGRYLVSFNCMASNTNNGTTTTYTIYVGGSPVAQTERRYVRSGGANASVTSQLFTTVNGSQAVAVFWRRSANTSTTNERSLIVQRV